MKDITERIKEAFEREMRKEHGDNWKELDWKDFFKHAEKRKEEEDKQRGKIVRKFHDYQLSFIYKNLDKRFELGEDEKVYEKILEECIPTVRIFYHNLNGDLDTVPLYVNERLLE